MESGENVSEKQLLQYIIDRVDSLEKSINFKGQNASEKNSKSAYEYEICVEFEQDKAFERSEINEIIHVFFVYSIGTVTTEHFGFGNIIEVKCVINERDKVDLINDLEKQIVSKKKIEYRIKSKPRSR